MATHPDTDRLTVLSAAAAQVVACDVDTDPVIVCGGYVAAGEASAPVMHIYRLTDGTEIASYRVEYFENFRNDIGDVVVDNGIVVSCDSEQHCIIDFYNVAMETHIRSDSIYQPSFAVDKSSHTLAALNTGLSINQIYFYDTQTGKLIAGGQNARFSSWVKWNSSAFETWNAHFSISGQKVEGKATASCSSSI